MGRRDEMLAGVPVADGWFRYGLEHRWQARHVLPVSSRERRIRGFPLVIGLRNDTEPVVRVVGQRHQLVRNGSDQLELTGAGIDRTLLERLAGTLEPWDRAQRGAQRMRQ